MNIIIITNSYKRDQQLVERSLEHSLKHAAIIQKLIFVDQNRESLKLSESISSNSKLEHIKTDKSCVSEARNLVSIPDETDWLVFCDDDGYIAEDYFDIFFKTLEKDPELEIIAGSIIRDDNFDFYSPRHKIGGDLNKFRYSKLLMGSNFAVRAKVFKELEGFDERFGAGSILGSGEETDFAWKAYFAKKRMLYQPEMKVFHIRPYAGTLDHSIKKAELYGIGKGALVSKWLFERGQLPVLFELIEMILIPSSRILLYSLMFKLSEVRIQLAVIKGRLKGLFRYYQIKNT